MPRIPTTSPATGAPLPAHYIHTLDSNFVDQNSRVRILRGVNLCGSSKAPVGQPSWMLDGFWEAVEAGDGQSFIGRPLELTKDEIRRMNIPHHGPDGQQQQQPLRFDLGSLGDMGEADIHLARLRGWGFTLLRFVFTWEALEHAGPKQYDEEFIQHLVRILQRCKAHGFLVFLDPHQDVWSRFTGGSGAPYWTLIACGMNPRSLTATQAALLHNEYPAPAQPTPESFPAMIWGTNYSRLASQTLFTLFFAGRHFAPKCIIDGMNIQDYLQSHFINAVAHLGRRLREAGGLLDECVIGWDSINEPFEGMIGYEDLRRIAPQQALKKGSTPSPAQSFRLGMGIKQEDIEWWDFGSFGPRRNGSVDIDPNGVKLWVEPELADEVDGVNGRWGWTRSAEWKLGQCIWALHGVWDPSQSTPDGRSPPPAPGSTRAPQAPKDADILIPDYFLYKPTDDPTDEKFKVDFAEEYFRPHIKDYFAALRVHHPELIPFVQPPVFHPPPLLEEIDDDDPSSDILLGRGCFSTHYYDGLTLMTRHWNWFNADALGVLRGKYSSPVFAVKVGEKAIRKSIREQLGVLKGDALRMGAFPTVIGEIGIPMELDDKYSYGGRDGKGKGRGDYREQVKALDASLSAADGDNLLSYTTWTYCPDSSHKWGDGWNLEDLSLWSADDERKTGSISGLKKDVGLVRSNHAATAPRDEKHRVSAIVQAVEDDDTNTEDEQIRIDLPTLSSKGTELVGFQVSSKTLTLSDLVKPYSSPPVSLSTSLTLTDPTSSRATLPPSYAVATVHTESAHSLCFPNFTSAPRAFAFLTNGARAWKAFVRCYPLAVVGTPSGWEWDCTTATFEMKVRVGADDRAGFTDEDAIAAAETIVGEMVEQEVPTEIFVPLLHFARDDIVQRAFGIPVAEKREVRAGQAANTANGNPNAATAVPLLDDASTTSLPGPAVTADAYTTGGVPKNSISSNGDDSASRAKVQHAPEDGEEDMLDLDVSINGGRVSVDGQVLRWWYPIPTTFTAPPQSETTTTTDKTKEPQMGPDGKVEYTITIKRRGGAIDFKKLHVPENWVGMGPRTDFKKSQAGDNGRKAECCDGCVVQ